MSESVLYGGQSIMEDPLLSYDENRKPNTSSRSAHVRLLRIGFAFASTPQRLAAIPPQPTLPRDATNVLRYDERIFDSLGGEGWHLAIGSDTSVELFSATCYYFGQRLASRHPIGLIEAAVGGTRDSMV